MPTHLIGAPLGRLLVSLVVLAVGALMIPALIWSQKKPAVVAAGLTAHAIGLAGVEALLVSLPVADGLDPYPAWLIGLTAMIHGESLHRNLSVGIQYSTVAQSSDI